MCRILTMVCTIYHCRIDSVQRIQVWILDDLDATHYDRGFVDQYRGSRSGSWLWTTSLWHFPYTMPGLIMISWRHHHPQRWDLILGRRNSGIVPVSSCLQTYWKSYVLRLDPSLNNHDFLFCLTIADKDYSDSKWCCLIWWTCDSKLLGRNSRIEER